MYYYKRVQDSVIVSVEAKSLDAVSPNFTNATKTEYDGFIAALPVVEPEPPRDLAAELDILAARMDAFNGAALTLCDVEVFSGTSPTSWTDLDLSGTVGSNEALVILKITTVQFNLNATAVRKNGDTDEFHNVNAETNAYGCALAKAFIGVHAVFLVTTDNTGKIEWKAESSRPDATVDIITYIK